MNIFEETKSRVDIITVAEGYGIIVNKNKALCPFHNDKTPSLSFKNQQFTCFACNIGGDVIEFARRLFNLESPLLAVKKLNEDFNLNLDVETFALDKVEINKYKSGQELAKAFEDWKENAYWELSAKFKKLRNNKRIFAPKTDTEVLKPQFVEALNTIGRVEYLLEILRTGSLQDKISLFKEWGDYHKPK